MLQIFYALNISSFFFDDVKSVRCIYSAVQCRCSTSTLPCVFNGSPEWRKIENLFHPLLVPAFPP